MGDQDEAKEQLMVCPRFLYATCKYGEDCEYVHYMTDILPKDVPCEYYLRGCCRYGRKCWSLHPNRKTKVERLQDGKIKLRFSFVLHHIRKIRISYLLNKMPRKIFPKSLEMFLRMKPKEGEEKLPMTECIHFKTGRCPFGRYCPCLHGLFCELCQRYCVDPTDPEHRKSHEKLCMETLERDLELSFAIQCSIDKVCGICLEVVMEKEVVNERRFGILEKCNHVYCLTCIREWRKRVNSIDALQDGLDEPLLDERLVRACPSCRVASDFVTPSQYWFLTDEEKQIKIECYKAKLKMKPCKYFDDNNTCPFGNLCFYRHSMPDGTLVELSSPKKNPRRSRGRNRDVEIFEDFRTWYYNEEGEADLYFLEEDLLDNYILVTRPL